MMKCIAILLARISERDSKPELKEEETAGRNLYLLNVL